MNLNKTQKLIITIIGIPLLLSVCVGSLGSSDSSPGFPISKVGYTFIECPEGSFLYHDGDLVDITEQQIKIQVKPDGIVGTETLKKIRLLNRTDARRL